MTAVTAEEMNGLRAEAVPIAGYGWTQSAAPVPLVHLDARARPDLVDLRRVAWLDRGGRALFDVEGLDQYAGDDDGWFALRVSVRRPVRSTFVLVLSLRTTPELLAAITRAGRLALTTDKMLANSAPAVVSTWELEMPSNWLHETVERWAEAERWAQGAHERAQTIVADLGPDANEMTVVAEWITRHGTPVDTQEVETN
jgi:hypothetical protein